MRPHQLLRLPLSIAALATGAKSFAGNPVLGSQRLNRLGLHTTRLRLAHGLARWRRLWLAPVLGAEERAAFARDGYVLKENFLPPGEFEQLRREVLESEWEVGEMRQGGTRTRRVPLDYARLRHSHPALARLIRESTMPRLLRYVSSSGGQPIFSLQAILAEASDAHDPQSDLHADTFQSTAKAWLFLHDVGEEDGPFRYVPGSHRLTQARLAWEKAQSIDAKNHPVPYHARGSFRVTPEELERMGLPPAKPCTVKANTLVVADTFGFHGRTPSPHPTCRVEVYASLRRSPFVPWPGLDPFSLPYIRSRAGSARQLLLAVGKRFGLAKMPFRPVGKMRIDA